MIGRLGPKSAREEQAKRRLKMNDYVRVVKGVRIVSLLAIAALLACASPAAAVVDTFWAEVPIQVGGCGNVSAGGGSGYNGGEWYFYHGESYVDTWDDAELGWWTQWFYNDPFDPDRWKEIDYSITISRLDTDWEGWVEIWWNWSTPEYSMTDPAGPPLPPLSPEEEDLFIARDPLRQYYMPNGSGSIIYSAEPQVLVENYNPAWVSIDIRGSNFKIDGTIDHRCVPEPATLGVLAMGSGLALMRRRHRPA